MTNGMEVEKGTGVVTLIRYTSFSEKAFTRALDFVPERWDPPPRLAKQPPRPWPPLRIHENHDCTANFCSAVHTRVYSPIPRRDPIYDQIRYLTRCDLVHGLRVFMSVLVLPRFFFDSKRGRTAGHVSVCTHIHRQRAKLRLPRVVVFFFALFAHFFVCYWG